MTISHERGDKVEIVKPGPLKGAFGEIVMIDAARRPPLYGVILDRTHGGRKAAFLLDEDMIKQQGT